MQQVASEMNHSETVFVRRKSTSVYEIRWFTPTAEEPFCGHGVLAAAKALHDKYRLGAMDFCTFSGIDVSASIPSNQQCGTALKISMHFPSSPIVSRLAVSEDVRLGFAKALGIDEGMVVAIGQNELRDVVVEVHPDVDFSEAYMDIDPIALLSASPAGTRSQVITSRGGKEGVDFLKRVFAYGSEDQATGSTYCALVPYWCEKLSKTKLNAVQPSRRGGKAELIWKKEEGLVEVVAQCIQTVEGTVVISIKPPNLLQKSML